MKSTKKHPTGHYAVSMRGEVYDRVVAEADRRGVPLTQIIDEAVRPALGLAPRKHAMARKRSTDRRIDVTGRAYVHFTKVAKAQNRTIRDVLDEEINRALDAATKHRCVGSSGCAAWDCDRL